MGRRWIRLRGYLAIAILGVLGLACSAYVLIHEGALASFGDVYQVRVELTAADGIGAGGQPVNVAGVRVGSVTGTTLARNGDALVTMGIERHQLPRVYANATVALVPITPLADLELQLDPGSPPAPALRSGATIGVGETSSPVPLESLLSSLDADTREYLASLITSLDQGTRGNGDNLRRLLLALGPTTRQVDQITSHLARRRVALARLVHDLALVTTAASRDKQLTSVVEAGNETLQAVAQENTPLREAISKLPGTLRSVHDTLGVIASFADQLTPTLTALVPPVRGLPSTLKTLRPLADATTSVLSRQLRPLVRDAQPLVRNLGLATPRLSALVPNVARAFLVLNYILNEFAYNPGHNDPGIAFWTAWFFHNVLSVSSTEDAHGTTLGVTILASCQTALTALDSEIKALVGAFVGLDTLCPGS